MIGIHYYLLAINFTGTGEQRALDQGKALDAQLLLGLFHSLYPWVLLLTLGLGLGHNLAGRAVLLQVLLGQTSGCTVSIAVVHLGTGTDSHLLTTFIFFG